MSVQNVVPIHPIDVESFQWTSENFDLVMALETKSQHHRSDRDSTAGEHKCRYKISCQSFTRLLRYFSLKGMDRRH